MYGENKEILSLPLENSIMSKYSRHLAKILSPFPNKVFPDKGTLILPVSLNVRLILLINYFKLLTDI